MQCECFSLCGADAAREFRARLPRSVSHGPWVEYLQAVYGFVELPFDVSQLQFFWAHLLPTAMHLCPKPHAAPPQAVLPTCSPEACDGWLEPAATAAVADDSSFIWPPIWPPLPNDAEANASPKERRRLARTQFLLIQPRERAGEANDSWVEVMRVVPPGTVLGADGADCDVAYGWQRDCQEWRPGTTYPWQPAGYFQSPNCRPLGCCREGRNYGCWFWPAKGSGIFVHLGRTAVMRDRHHAEESGYGVRAQVWLTKHGRNGTVRLRGNDCMYARAARDFGLDSLQVLRANRNVFTGQKTSPVSEIVLTADGCVHPHRIVTHACPPVPLRSGVGLRKQPCACSRNKHLTVLNCGESVSASAAARARYHGRSSV